ncbi:endo-1,4-beta-xylanase [Candidatus Latescibacterota bacterium]
MNWELQNYSLKKVLPVFTCILLFLLILPETGHAQLAQGQEKFLGNVYSRAQIPDFEKYWNQVTPENAGKWGSVERTRDEMNWDTLDAAYKFAKDNGFIFRYHVLVWGNQQPAWIETLPKEEQLEEIVEWYTLIAERFPDIDYIEVVNEPLHDPPSETGSGGGNYIEALGGSGETGWDWILTSFRLARKHFPNTKLMINDYNIINNDESSAQYLEIVKLLQAENLIDVIGVQAHAFSVTAESATMQKNLDLLATSGLPLMVTELDIDGIEDDVQAKEYQRIIPLLWEHPSMIGMTFWGWKPGQWRTRQGANLIREDGTERPAMVWLREYMSK